MEPPVLAQFPETPVYELNQMVRLVNVRPLTLWAWEQQLGLAGAEQGSDASSRKRRYSQRDLMALMWVRDRIVAGESLQDASARLVAAQRGTRGPGYLTSGPGSSGPLNGGPMSGSLTSGPLSSGALNSGALYPPTQPAGLAPTYDPAQAGAQWAPPTNGSLGAATYTGGAGMRNNSTGSWGSPTDPWSSEQWPTGGQWNAGGQWTQGQDTRPSSQSGPLGRATAGPSGALTGGPQFGGNSGRLGGVFGGKDLPYTPREHSYTQTSANMRELRPYVSQLLQSFARFDTASASAVLTEALQRTTVESVCIGLVQTTVARISELWSKSELSNPEERFALNYLRSFMYSIFHSTPEPMGAPFVVVGCAPNETSDFGALLLAVLWRRAGMRVAFLGRGLDGDQLLQENWPITPAVIALTATTSQRLRTLARIGKRIGELPAPQPIFAFCGPVFVRNPELRRRLHGVYLGDDAATATQYICQLLNMDTFNE